MHQEGPIHHVRATLVRALRRVTSRTVDFSQLSHARNYCRRGFNSLFLPLMFEWIRAKASCVKSSKVAVLCICDTKTK